MHKVPLQLLTDLRREGWCCSGSRCHQSSDDRPARRYTDRSESKGKTLRDLHRGSSRTNHSSAERRDRDQSSREAERRGRKGFDAPSGSVTSARAVAPSEATTPRATMMLALVAMRSNENSTEFLGLSRQMSNLWV